ncbi:YdcF family protein [Actinomadura rugatobispora]|uniref:YdcF family protein n=1 Tax=Actinomadura rugatobispora TaxID=1994 RepID=A0ABW0ZZI8_9ACTN|nr:YdcF family protein [Actinomadura rugatobispora]
MPHAGESDAAKFSAPWPEVRELGRLVWDHLVFVMPMAPSQVILAMGCHDPRVAVQAARLWHEGWAPLVVVSGGRGKVTEGWAETEARVFARVVREHGVPGDAVLLEETAANTGENITATRALLAARGVPVERGILVAKPYMTRRSLATAARQWPGVDWRTSAPEVSYETYLEGDARRFLELMVGDLQRMAVYAERGFQVPMPVPEAAWAAHEELARLGYDRYVIT